MLLLHVYPRSICEILVGEREIRNLDYGVVDGVSSCNQGCKDGVENRIWIRPCHSQSSHESSVIERQSTEPGLALDLSFSLPCTPTEY